MNQSTQHILMVRPAHFGYNPQTANSNSFQEIPKQDPKTVHLSALLEFDQMVEQLREKGVDVTVVEDTDQPVKWDAIFPNNWLSTHLDGSAVLYPMLAPVRRMERRLDILQILNRKFHLKKTLDFSNFELQNTFLEGTGSIVMDRVNAVAYACISERTNNELFEQFCRSLRYRPVIFHATDRNGESIYHTNVMMALGTHVAIVCSESIRDDKERSSLLDSLQKTGHKIIGINFDQLEHFAGNMIELRTASEEKLLILSKNAYRSLHKQQTTELEEYYTLVPIDIPTIEQASGGSVRCMIAEVFLPPLS